VPILNVYKSFVNSVNDSGGINGHPIQLIDKDDASMPANSVAAAQSLLSSGVVAIVDQTILTESWAKMVNDAKVPVIGVNLTETAFYSYPYFFPEGQTNDSMTYALAATAKASGATTMGELYCVEAPSCQELVDPVIKSAQSLGLQNVYSAKISATAPNYTAQCIAAQQAKVQALFIAHSTSVVAKVAADCQRQGYNPTYITEGIGATPALMSAPGLKDNTWSVYNTLPFWSDAAPVQTMNAAIDKYFPGLRNQSDVYNQLAAMAWPSGLLLQAGIKASGLTPTGTLTTDMLVKGLQSLKDETLSGWSPPLNFVAGQPTSIKCWLTSHLANGTPTLVNGGKTTCQS
jgi:branched-chain amino acid transport system substrate-binding protein